MGKILPFVHRHSENIASTAKSVARFAEERSGHAVRVFRAPGRVNLIGEHTDYNDGFVLPTAIEFSTWAAAARLDEPRVVAYSKKFGDTAEFDPEGLPDASGHWSDYLAGVIRVLRDQEKLPSGAELTIGGDVPIGAGLSSSAALETVSAFALVSLAEKPIDRTQIALACQKAECDFVGVRVGIMDQFVSVHARVGHALLLDCRTLEHRFVPIPAGVTIVICNSMVRHELTGGEYNRRRAECEEGVRTISARIPEVRALRDVNLSMLARFKNELSPVIYRRCHHVVTENSRVMEAVEALARNDPAAFGRLMYESHRSLRDDYEVSCRELDLLVDFAAGAPGVLGARMTGGGFGGCTVNLVRSDCSDRFQESIAKEYRAATGIDPEIYVTNAAAGAEEVNVSGI